MSKASELRDLHQKLQDDVIEYTRVTDAFETALNTRTDEYAKRDVRSENAKAFRERLITIIIALAVAAFAIFLMFTVVFR